MRFLHSDAALLRIEAVNPPSGVAEPTHVHPHQESSAEVASGTLLFVVDGEERRVGPGETVTIPAGTPHNFVNDGDEDAVAIQEFRPALRTREFFEKPSLLRFAALGPGFADEIRLVSPPWPVQRALFALLGPIARRRGY
jgi:hypothetical protein